MTATDALHPLSLGQERLWFVEQLDPNVARYNSPVVLGISGPLDVVRLERALHRVIDRHEMLRTKIVDVDGVPFHDVRPDARVPLTSHDPVAALDDAFAAEVHATIHPPFDLAAEIPIRADLWQVGSDDQFVLALTFHHIATDAQSFRVIVKDLGESYERDTALTKLPASFLDYIVDERRRAQGDDVLSVAAERADELEHLLPPRLAGRLERRAGEEPEGHIVSVACPPAQTDLITQTAARLGGTPFMFLTALGTFLLAHEADQPRFPFVLTVSRRRARFNDVVGFFIDTEVLIADVASAKRLPDVLAHIRREVVRAISGPAIPLQLLVSELRQRGIFDWPDRLQVSFDLIQDTAATSRWGDLVVTQLDRVRDFRREAPPFDLEIDWWRDDARFGMSAIYDQTAYERASVERIVGQFSPLLAAAIANPDITLPELHRLVSS